MSGYCPDCGNTQCLCKDVAADGARVNEGSSYYRLFEHMSHKHNLVLLDSEMEDICQVVLQMRKYPERDFEVMLSRIVRLMEMSTNMGQLDSICAQARGLLNRKGTGSPLRHNV